MDDFLLHGYFRVEGVFSSEVASECSDVIWRNLAESSIDRNDSTTWVKKHSIAESYSFETFPWKNVYTTKFKDAISSLISPNTSENFGCGWWMITFPGFEPMDSIWRPDGSWHIDGHIHRHYPYSKEIGLVPIIFFSDVLPDGGGTAVAEGSHLVASKILTEAGLKGMTSKELAGAVISTNIPFNIVELTGKAGDIIFIHPLLLHARSTNLANLETKNIRIMCHPSISLQTYLNFDRPFISLSILEKSIVCGALSIFSNVCLTESDVEIIVDIHNQYITNQNNVVVQSIDEANKSISCDNQITENVLNVQLSHLSKEITNTLRILRNINPDSCMKFQEKQLKRKRGQKSHSHDDNYSDSEFD